MIGFLKWSTSIESSIQTVFFKVILKSSRSSYTWVMLLVLHPLPLPPTHWPLPTLDCLLGVWCFSCPGARCKTTFNGLNSIYLKDIPTLVWCGEFWGKYHIFNVDKKYGINSISVWYFCRFIFTPWLVVLEREIYTL